MGVSPVKDRATRSALLIAKREIAMRHHGNRAATENLAILRAFVVKPAQNPPRSHEDAKNHERFRLNLAEGELTVQVFAEACLWVVQ